MSLILKKFFWILKMMGKKIVILSYIVRFEQDKWNYLAGVDLFNKIYSEYGLSNRAIIFTNDNEKAMKSLTENGVKNVIGQL